MACSYRIADATLALRGRTLCAQAELSCRQSFACAPCGLMPRRAAKCIGHGQRSMHGHPALLWGRTKQHVQPWLAHTQSGIVFTSVCCSAEAQGAASSGANDANAQQPPPVKLPRSQARSMATLLDLLKHLLQFIQQPNGGASGATMSIAAMVMLDKIESVTSTIDPGESADVGQALFECRRYLQLIRLDLKMLAVAKKPETLQTRLKELGTKCETLLNLCLSIA